MQRFKWFYARIAVGLITGIGLLLLLISYINSPIAHAVDAVETGAVENRQEQNGEDSGNEEQEYNSFRSKSPGDIVEFEKYDPGNLFHLDYSKELVQEAQFLFSDQPEYFRSGNGIAMKEAAEPGLVRLYTYHVPEPDGGDKVISTVVENNGEETLTIDFTGYAFPEPGGHYTFIGKRGIEYFLTTRKTGENLPEPVTIEAGERKVLDEEVDNTVVRDPQLIHTWYEMETDQPATFYVFQRNVEDESTEIIDELELLPRILPGEDRSGAGRGLFEDSNIELTVSGDDKFDTGSGIPGDGAMRMVFADGDRDPWVKGYDSIAEGEYENRGNYGIFYDIEIEWESTDGRGVALLMHNRYAGTTGFCRNQSGVVEVNEGVDEGGLVRVPGEQIAYGGENENVLLQSYPPPEAGETGTIQVKYTPPGASCLPTPLFLVPYDGEVTSAEEIIRAEAPEQPELRQNYPNPFNPSTTISFSLDKPSEVTLEVFDITGKMVDVLVDETRSAGEYEVTFEATDLASGVYFYQLTAGEQKLQRQMTYIR